MVNVVGRVISVDPELFGNYQKGNNNFRYLFYLISPGGYKLKELVNQ
jgi:hypothetical protein